MRISDWSSDVCSSDLFESLASALGISLGTLLLGDDYADPSQPVRIDPATLAEALKLVDYDEDLGGEYEPQERARQVISAYEEIHAQGDRKSVVQGQSVSVRVHLGGRRIHKKITTCSSTRRTT